MCLLQFNNMLLYCVPRVLQVGAHFQVRTRIDVAGMKVRGTQSLSGFTPSMGTSRRGQPLFSIQEPKPGRSWDNMEVEEFAVRALPSGLLPSCPGPFLAPTGLAHILGWCRPQPGLTLLSLLSTPVLPQP